MTPIPPIPEDLQALAKNCVEQIQNDLPPEMTGFSAEIVYELIERIAKLTAEVERLEEEHRSDAIRVNRIAGTYRAECEALRADNTRLKAPVSDKEIHEFYSGECEAGVSFDFLRRFQTWLVSRATRTPSQEGEAK